MTNKKFYHFENCPGIMWVQKELTGPEFLIIWNNFFSFINSISEENVDLASALNTFLKETIPGLIKQLVKPYTGTWSQWLRVWYIRRVKKTDLSDAFQFATLSENAEVIADFFFLNKQWIQKLSGSAGSVGSILTGVISKIPETMAASGLMNSVGSSQKEDTTNTSGSGG
jgi:hypothetical protein